VTKPTKSILAAGTLALAVTASRAAPAKRTAAALSPGPASAARLPSDDRKTLASLCPSSLAGGENAPRDDDPNSGEGDGGGDDESED